MAHFQASIQGNRGPATRLGSSKSGIYAFARGWNGGARIDLWSRDGEDYIEISIGTHGDMGRYTITSGSIKQVLAHAEQGIRLVI